MSDLVKNGVGGTARAQRGNFNHRPFIFMLYDEQTVVVESI